MTEGVAVGAHKPNLPARSSTAALAVSSVVWPYTSPGSRRGVAEQIGHRLDVYAGLDRAIPQLKSLGKVLETAPKRCFRMSNVVRDTGIEVGFVGEMHPAYDLRKPALSSYLGDLPNFTSCSVVQPHVTLLC
jgi:hypothetical protein